MGSSGGGSSTTVQKADPWKGQQPYLTDIFAEAQRLYQSGGLAPDYYGGQTVAPQSDWTRQALAMQAQRALGGSASVDAAQGTVDAITAGQAMAGNQGLAALNAAAQAPVGQGNAGLAALEQMAQAQNPYLDSLYQDASREALSALNGSFSLAGRYGSGAHAAANADAAADLAAKMYGDAYAQQVQAAQHAASAYDAAQGRQISAAQAAGQLYGAGVDQQIAGAGMAQQLANQRYTDAYALAQAGSAQDQFAQQQINAEIDRWNYERQQPLNALSAYNRLVQGDYGGTTTTTGQQENRVSPLTGAISGATAGASIGGTPGAIIGALGGGLLSLF